MARSGDRDAFGGLVRLNQSMVFSLAWNSLRDEGEAEELAQEVFLELHRSLGGLESAAHATNWLRRVTIHRCIDSARRKKSHPNVALDEVPELAGPPEQGDLMLTEKLRRLMASLPEKARAVVLLRYQEDMEPSEIAQVLSMPLNTVKSHLQRSLVMLREKLERSRVRT